MNEQSAGHEEELPRTAYLDHTLRRARTAAEQRSHRYVTLEHLLLALLDDPDASRLLQTTGADIAVIHSTVCDAVNNRMASLVVPDPPAPSFSYRFDPLFASAAGDAKRLGRREIDGALALIAVAKDAESNASGILAANGFNAEAALEVVRASPQPQRTPQTSGSPQKPRQAKAAPQEAPVRNLKGQDQKPANAEASKPPMAAQAASMANGEGTMEDMIASVRTILEAEELKERDRDLTQRPSPSSRSEPQLRANGGASKPGERVREAAARLEPRIGPSSQPKRLSKDGASGMSGFAESPARAFDLEKPPKPEKRAVPGRPAPRGRAGNLALLAKVLENIPRNARVGSPQKIQISLGREEAGFISGRFARRGPQASAPGAETGCRAVTMRLTAPEGAFLVEALTPETQWLLDRPGEVASGTWAWTVVPSDSGPSCLKLTMSAREVDANGPGGVAILLDQTIKVRVRGNFWLAFGSFVRAVSLLITGSALTIGAFYAFKIASKLH